MSSPHWNPEWIWGMAILILAGAIAYGMMRASRRSRSERARTDEATERLYREEDRRG
jgi:hypothetical protein